MPDQIERTLRSLGGQLPGRVFRPGAGGYAAATAKPMPRAALELTDALTKQRSTGD